jgi:anti-anti-sigma regulatory factor
LVLDLRRVTFCDATGLRAIAQVHGWAATRGIDCQLWPSGAVRRIVSAAGCEKLLDGA